MPTLKSLHLHVFRSFCKGGKFYDFLFSLLDDDAVKRVLPQRKEFRFDKIHFLPLIARPVNVA